MITRTNAVEMSVRKWGKEIIPLVQKEKIDWDKLLDLIYDSDKHPCGFCQWRRKNKSSCEECILSPFYCFHSNQDYAEDLWHIIARKVLTHNPEGLLDDCARMLGEITTRGEQWIKEGKR